jgi:2-polyprenyl-3-methyl-5-hydroxy-6-metoxy-1,4-benzoquinol methylase
VKELKQYASTGIHDVILDCVKQLKRGTVLDVPSGQGALSKELEKLGFKPFSGDLEINNIVYVDKRSIQLNLNHVLPFRASAFDHVVCIEGVEHLENPHHLIREFARVLTDGGFLIISTPNVMTIKSRLRFLLYSYLDYFRYFGPLPPNVKYRVEEYEHQHVNPISYAEMKYILEKYGFWIETIEANRTVRRWRLLHPFLKRFIRYKTRKRFPEDPFYTSDTMLEGEDLIFIAKKRSTKE